MGPKQKIKFMVVINLSGLHKNIRKVKYINNGWWAKCGNVIYVENIDGCWSRMFDTLKDAEIFLAGAKFFRDFMCQGYFIERKHDE